MLTRSLVVRLPREEDRDRFVELFTDEEFMVFSAGVLAPEAAHRRFDEMLVRADELPFAKQPVIERATGSIIGYSGVNWFDFEGRRRLEFGYRLVPHARGRGYATEASRAVLRTAKATFRGELIAMIDPTNTASLGVAGKLGFSYWKQSVVDGLQCDILRLQVP